MSSEQNNSRWRCGPWRLAGAAVLLVIVALLCWSGARVSPLDKEIARRLSELRATGEPVDSQDLARFFPNPPPSENAGLLLTNLLAFATNNRLPAATPVVISRTPLARTVPMPESARGELRAYDERIRDLWPQWPSSWPDGMRFASHWERGMMSNSTPNFIQVRALAQLLAVLALSSAEDGDSPRATEMLERGFQFSRCIPSDSLVTHMIRWACVGLNVDTVERCLNQARFTDAQLHQVERALDHPSTDQFADALRGEHCMALWAFGELRAGRRAGISLTEKWWESLWRRIKSRRPAYSDDDFARYLAMYRPSLEAVTLPPTQAVARAAQLVEDYSTNTTSELGRMVPASWTKALRACFETDARLASLRTALALERFRIAHQGSLPTTLTELVPEHLPAVPRDIFDGQPLRYKVLPRGYVIYSIGADGVDDGGLEKTNSATKYDVTITVER